MDSYIIEPQREIATMDKKRVNVYGWTDEHDKYLQAVYKKLRAQGIPVERDGKPNASAILLYLLEKAAKDKK